MLLDLGIASCLTSVLRDGVRFATSIFMGMGSRDWCRLLGCRLRRSCGSATEISFCSSVGRCVPHGYNVVAGKPTGSNRQERSAGVRRAEAAGRSSRERALSSCLHFVHRAFARPETSRHRWHHGLTLDRLADSNRHRGERGSSQVTELCGGALSRLHLCV